MYLSVKLNAGPQQLSLTNIAVLLADLVHISLDISNSTSPEGVISPGYAIPLSLCGVIPHAKLWV